MAEWRDELARWLAPFVERFGHKARRRMCPLYVAGLIGPGDRASIPRRADHPRTDVKRLLVRGGSLHAACATDRLRRREAANTRPRRVRSAAAPCFRPTQRPGNGPPIDRPAARKMAIWPLSSSERCE
jgi:hypothetical protein